MFQVYSNLIYLHIPLYLNIGKSINPTSMKTSDSYFLPTKKSQVSDVCRGGNSAGASGAVHGILQRVGRTQQRYRCRDQEGLLPQG
jgi:hypothetical protein